ncbi:MAG: carboxymuconolactone decarboxylase family protein [Planctomycetota bacterium]
MSLAVVPDLCRLTAAVVLHDADALAAFARRHGHESSSAALREALLQCHLFCGFPRTIAALDALRSAGLVLDGPADEDHEPARGAALFDRIYGESADDVRAHLGRLDPTFATWVAEHAYGRVLSRPALDAAARELLAVAALAATGHERQLASHVRGAIRCGASQGDVHAALTAVEDALGPERLERARAVAERFARSD